jgi:acetyl esterase/lipase
VSLFITQNHCLSQKIGTILDTIFNWGHYPPAFITVSEDDQIVNVSVADRRVENMRNAGTEVEYRKYKNASHGFGLGTVTDADCWIEHAIQFLKNH